MIVPHDECQRCGSPLPTPGEWPWSLIGGVCPDYVAWFREWAATGDEPVCSAADLDYFLIGTGITGRIVICNLAAALPEHIVVTEVVAPTYERERGKKRLVVEIKLPIPAATLREAVVQATESLLGGKGQLGAVHD